MITAIVQIMTSISIIILLVLIVFTNKRLAQLEVKIERCRDLYNGIDLGPLRFKIRDIEEASKLYINIKYCLNVNGGVESVDLKKNISLPRNKQMSLLILMILKK